MNNTPIATHKISVLRGVTKFGQSSWWYGEQWSAMDAYLFWAITRLQSADFSLAEWPNLQRFVQAMLTRPAVQRALAKESELS